MKKKYIWLIAAVLAAALAIAAVAVWKCRKKAPACTGEKDTLLIYMVGSDLEYDHYAGTEDLKEIENSGVDTRRVNILVYAGGCPEWGIDKASGEHNTILLLTKTGFCPVDSPELASMGQADTLLYFLNYGYENYPGKSYGLILWNHGYGPVMGYGSDMLFDKDALTLYEMADAMARSPFRGENKLAWVGFDACLMASAELACVWDEYAHYLVASQEIEPYFGWDYSFLKQYGRQELTRVLEELVDGYVEECLDYYQKRQQEFQETTLSCIDLSCGPQLEEAINALFRSAGDDVALGYNGLAARRVNTRAFGRASTGSEYDLIDLADMAQQLSSLYPEETEALLQVLEKAVIHNGTNAQKACGLSLYYPFYSKYRYQKSWSQEYSALGLFDSYRAYLQRYEQLWLAQSDPDSFVFGNIPYTQQTQTGTKYCLELTSEQNENFASARSYILKRMAGDIFLVVFADNRVENSDGILTTHSDGKAIYAKNSYNQYYLPLTECYDTVGGITRYGIHAQGWNIDREQYKVDGIQGYSVDPIHIQLALNQDTQAVSLRAVTLEESAPSEEHMGTGRAEERYLEDWEYINFLNANYAYIKRYDNNTIAPLSQWNYLFDWESFEIDPGDGLEFVYAPLDDGEYFLIFEITDTRNNQYCSEMIPLAVDAAGDKEQLLGPEAISLRWDSGEKIKLYEAGGVELYLTMVEDAFLGRRDYVLEGINHNDYEMTVECSRMVINGEISTAKTIGLYMQPGDSDTSLKLGNAAMCCCGADVEKITDISLTLCVTRQSITTTGDWELKDQDIHIALSGDRVLDLQEDCGVEALSYPAPFYGAHASRQVIVDNERVCVTLCEFGSEEHMYTGSNPGYLIIENKTDKNQSVAMEILSVNGITMDGNLTDDVIAPHCRVYTELPVSGYMLDEYGIAGIESLKICFSFYGETRQVTAGPQEMLWTEVALDVRGQEVPEPEPEGQMVFDQNGVKVYITGFEAEGGKRIWYATAVNDSDWDITLRFPVKNQLAAYAEYGDTRVGAHQRRNFALCGWVSETGETLVVQVMALDFYKQRVLFSSDDYITLSHAGFEP